MLAVYAACADEKAKASNAPAKKKPPSPPPARPRSPPLISAVPAEIDGSRLDDRKVCSLSCVLLLCTPHQTARCMPEAHTGKHTQNAWGCDASVICPLHAQLRRVLRSIDIDPRNFSAADEGLDDKSVDKVIVDLESVKGTLETMDLSGNTLTASLGRLGDGLLQYNALTVCVRVPMAACSVALRYCTQKTHVL